MNQPVLARDIFDRLRQAAASNPEVLAELCRDYILEARQALSQIQAALAEGDASRLRERAHYVKGSSLMIGARQLAECCAALEQTGRDGDLSSAAPALENALTALRAVEAELSQEVGPTALPNHGSAA